MNRQEVEDYLRLRIGTPRQHTLGQIMATIRDHEGCYVVYEDADGRRSQYRLGAEVHYNWATVVLTNHRTF